MKIPRGRKRPGSKKASKTPGPKTHSVARKKAVEEAVFSDEQYGLDLYHGFMRSDEDVIAISYRVNTGNIAKEDIVKKYKSQMISALMKAGRKKGLSIPIQQIKFQALPLGEDSIIKAYALMRNVRKQRDGSPVKERTSNDPFGWGVNSKAERQLK